MKSKTLKEYEGRLCKVKDLYAIVDDIVEIRNQMYKHLNSQKAYDDINQLNENELNELEKLLLLDDEI
mgnify:CR=1 FL=1